MKGSIVLLLVVVALVAGEDLRSDFVAYSRECAQTFSIPVEQIAELRATKDKTTIQASDNLKSFIKCVVGKSGFVVAGGEPNWERLINIAVATGYVETTVRTNVEKCKSLYTGSHTANDAWIVYSCVLSF